MKLRPSFITFAVLLLVPATGIFYSSNVPDADAGEVKPGNIAAEIHKRIFTIDAHTDTPITLLHPWFRLDRRYSYSFNGPKLDFPRMKEGGLDSVFFAIFVRQGELNETGYADAKKHVYRLIDIINKRLKDNPETAYAAYSPGDAESLFRNNRISVFTGIENAYSIGTDITLIKDFFKKGVRYITLCHTSNNQICDSSTDPRGSFHNGISSFGRRVIDEMNSTGMIIDVSHVSDKSFYDILKMSEAPVIASHSNARAICNHPRNISDNMLKRLAENRGVINLSLWSGYVEKPEFNKAREQELKSLEKKYMITRETGMKKLQSYFTDRRNIIRKYSKNKPALSRLIDHIDHVVKTAGIDHVGIGSDFDGGGGLEDCLDVSQIGNITHELVKRGYLESDIRKIWGENLMRVFREVLQISGK